MNYEVGETYTGYEKGEVFEFTVTEVVDSGVYIIELHDLNGETGRSEEKEALDRWVNAYSEYIGV